MEIIISIIIDTINYNKIKLEKTNKIIIKLFNNKVLTPNIYDLYNLIVY